MLGFFECLAHYFFYCTCFVFRCEVRVAFCHLNSRMSHELFDCIQVNLRHKELTCKAMAQIVKPKVFETSSASQSFPRLFDGVKSSAGYRAGKDMLTA